MKKIIISPYSKKLREKETPHPKNFPMWKELLLLLPEYEIIQIGVEGEERLVENCKFNLPTSDLIELSKDIGTWVSVENFFPHFMHYNHPEKRGVVIFSQSDPFIFGYPKNINLLKDKKHLRWDQYGPWELAEYKKEAFVEPEAVVEAIKSII